MELHTFGKTPAAIYLAYQLVQCGDKRLATQVGYSLSHFRELVASLERANNTGVMAQRQMSAFGNLLRTVADGQYEKFSKKNQLIANLIRNIMIGELKSLQRRGSALKQWNKDIQRDLADATEHLRDIAFRNMPSVDDVRDEIDPEYLINKSREKLDRKGKLSTLY